MLTSQIDLTGLQNMMEGIQYALIGAGKDGDAAKVTADEGRLLAVEIAAGFSPKNQKVGEKKVERDVKKFLTAPIENIIHDPTGDVRFIQAGKNFLTGVRASDDWRNADNTAAITVLHLEKQKNRGPKYTKLGQHGSQAVRLINRAVFSPLVQHNVTRLMASRVGRLKATMMETAKDLGHKNIPEWIRRHFPSKKRIFKDGLANTASPSIEFGSRSIGVSHFVPKVKRAVKNRTIKLRKRLNLILFGYAQDQKAGRRITRQAAKVTPEEKMNNGLFDAL